MKSLRSIHLPAWTVPLALLVVAVLAYGLLVPSLGFYWDDWSFAWITRTFGNAGLTRYFSTNRPFWGLIYKLTTPLLGQNPSVWQAFGITWRWASAAALWWALRQVWPRRGVQAAWAALLFLVYPGFGQQAIALTFGHIFLVLTIFFLSLGAMATALRRPRRFYLLSALALLASLVNLFTLEYFFALDLLRPLLVWVILRETVPDLRARAVRTLRLWLPYAALVALYAAWRLFVFKFPTYQPELFGGEAVGAGSALASLPLTILQDLWLVSFGAWARIWPAAFLPEGKIVQAIALVIAATAAGVWAYLAALRPAAPPAGARPEGPLERLDWILIGLLALLLGGLPFWLTRLPVGLTFPNDRFTLPAMLGASLLLVGLLDLIPPRALKVALLGAAIGLAAGVQFVNAYDHRLDWKDQKTFFWQLSWRAPAIAPGTLLLSSDTPFRYESDNSLTAPLNWLYAPDDRDQRMAFLYYFISVRLGLGLPGLEPGLPVDQSYLAAGFEGSTSQALVIHYAPPLCLRVLDPVYDAGTPLLPQPVKDALHLSRPALIQPAPDAGAPFLERFFSPETSHGWCYYYEKAALARQVGDWGEVARLGDAAFALDEHPNAAEERLPFIEGYAHAGRWADAERLTREARDVTPLVRPMLCATWERIAAIAPPLDGQAASVGAMRTALACPAGS